MLRLGRADRGTGRLIDPMCGAATIPIEAYRINPRLEIAAADWDEPTVELARRSIAEHGLQLTVEHADARSLGHRRPGGFDYIVSDPPYGVRQARRTSIGRLYGALLPAFERALADGGRIVLLVLKYQTFLGAVERTGLEILDQRKVDLGGLTPRIVVLGHGP
jgi:putative N6-adenine-specific DNA methylase/tRNA (guanine6-N2)-methyltransferase